MKRYRSLLLFALCAALMASLCAGGAFSEAAQTSWTCESCGWTNDKNFCVKCGAPKPAAANGVICPGCGKELPAEKNFRFCIYCGTPLGTANLTPTEPPAQKQEPELQPTAEPASALNTNARQRDFYGRYQVYQVRLPSGYRVDALDYGLVAEISESGVRAAVYGREIDTAYRYQDGQLRADFSAVYPYYPYLTAGMNLSGEIEVSLLDASGAVGETLYLRSIE